VKNRVQSLPFKCNLQRYNEALRVVLDRAVDEHSLGVGAVAADGESAGGSVVAQVATAVPNAADEEEE
jgi:hypothetical protein